jgi:hypothetical protein
LQPKLFDDKQQLQCHPARAFRSSLPFLYRRFTGIQVTLTGYLDFSFDLGGFDLVRALCLAAVFAGMLYRHLRLTVRLSPRILTALAAVVVAVPFAGAQGYASRRRLCLREVAIAKSCQFPRYCQSAKTRFQQGFSTIS